MDFDATWQRIVRTCHELDSFDGGLFDGEHTGVIFVKISNIFLKQGDCFLLERYHLAELIFSQRCIPANTAMLCQRC